MLETGVLAGGRGAPGRAWLGVFKIRGLRVDAIAVVLRAQDGAGNRSQRGIRRFRILP